MPFSRLPNESVVVAASDPDRTGKIQNWKDSWAYRFCRAGNGSSIWLWVVAAIAVITLTYDNFSLRFIEHSLIYHPAQQVFAQKINGYLVAICERMLIGVVAVVVWRIFKAGWIQWRLKVGQLVIVPELFWECWEEACRDQQIVAVRWDRPKDFQQLLDWYLHTEAYVRVHARYITEDHKARWRQAVRREAARCARLAKLGHTPLTSKADDQEYRLREAEFAKLIGEPFLRLIISLFVRAVFDGVAHILEELAHYREAAEQSE